MPYFVQHFRSDILNKFTNQGIFQRLRVAVKSTVFLFSMRYKYSIDSERFRTILRGVS